MHVTASILIAATTVFAVPNAVDTKPSLVRAEEDLTEWFKSSVPSIFPNHTGWETSYAQYFNQTLVASFGLAKYNYSSLQGFYTIVNELVSADGYNPFTVEFTSITINPNTDDAGGMAVATGLVKGYKNGTLVASATDGLFATISIVNDERKFTEWHEISNFKLS
ncbi:hypothetical protein DFH08DRAFT_808826 [Mycena albidolilacea]|uniref:Uncharacterized protein n=1 Tax=Mycena albidolilacea TaxID=1033008 RepID=A0AAD7ER76_9AGAR|nr:hypothetical protein DFH08DRAFT_808826 [Mycena albidolilacea]